MPVHVVTLEGTNAGPSCGMVFYNGRPICDDDQTSQNVWDLNAGNVVCRMLVFSAATKIHHNSDFGGGYPPKGSMFAMSGLIHCTGSEEHFLDCSHDQAVSTQCATSGRTGGSIFHF